MEKENRKKRSMTWNIMNILMIMFFLMIMYFIGFSQGQASVYEKKTDDTSLDDLYKMEVEVKK
jgi:hypothetical protein